jgi:hypothetical protein
MMNAGHLLPHQSRRNRRTDAEMRTRHRKWPLGTKVCTLTPAGYLEGRVFKHWQKGEVAAGCSVEFPVCVDMEDANGARFCHVISFRNLRKTSRV